MKKLNDDLRRGERELSKSTGEKDYLATKIDELNLHNDSSQRSLKKMTSEKDDLMVLFCSYFSLRRFFFCGASMMHLFVLIKKVANKQFFR